MAHREAAERVADFWRGQAGLSARRASIWEPARVLDEQLAIQQQHLRNLQLQLRAVHPSASDAARRRADIEGEIRTFEASATNTQAKLNTAIASAQKQERALAEAAHAQAQQALQPALAAGNAIPVAIPSPDGPITRPYGELLAKYDEARAALDAAHRLAKGKAPGSEAVVAKAEAAAARIKDALDTANSNPEVRRAKENIDYALRAAGAASRIPRSLPDIADAKTVNAKGLSIALNLFEDVVRIQRSRLAASAKGTPEATRLRAQVDAAVARRDAQDARLEYVLEAQKPLRVGESPLQRQQTLERLLGSAQAAEDKAGKASAALHSNFAQFESP
jgi:hypothetical protein